MIYTDLTKKALKISFFAHKNQTDISGMPYVYHPFHLAEQMDDEYATCVALLHDVVEDTNISLEELKAEGFPKEVTDALALMTHDDSVPYYEYIKMIKMNPLATKVKLADLRHNSDLSRLDHIDAKALERKQKYKKSIYLLEGWTQPSDYRLIDAVITPCCSVKVPADYRYCPCCGNEIHDAESSIMEFDNEYTVTFCGKCGKTYPFEHRYCGYCGTRSQMWIE